MTVFLRTLFFVTLGLAAWQAHADVYGFVDEQGEVHLADKPLDARYRLFKRGALPAASSSAATAELGRYLDARDQAALKRLTPLIEQTARRHQLEPALLHAVITVESGYHASAASPKGAQGLMQLMPDTAARFGVSAETVLEPRANLDAGARYLAFLLGLFDRRLDLALAAYNAGEGVVQRLGRIPPYEETEQYVKA
ncbi:lytic transglycosylase domain-containing protein, partial [Rivihabitans pingtungensis]